MLKDLNLVGGMTNTDWLNQFHDEMRTYKITQGQLAKTADYSRSHLNQLLTGRNPINKQARLRLTLALRSLTGQNNIDVCIDYLGVTFKSHDYEELVTELFQINPNHFNLKEGARYGYAATLKCGEIDVLLSPYQDVNADGYDPSEDSGTMIELKGQGCRYVESYLRQQDRTWYDFLETCIALDGHFTRVDLAINDRNGLLDVPTLIEKCDRDEFTSRFHGFRDNRTKQWEVSGRTLYLGSPQSEVYFCIYDKAFEQHQKHPEIAIEDQPIRTRFEVRLRRKRAAAAIKNLLAERDPEKVVFGIINRYLRFLTPSHKAKSQWATDPRWDAFIGNYRDKLRLSTNPEPLSYAHITRWLKKQVAPSLKMLQLIDQYNGTTELKAIIDGGKLTQRHWDLIHHYQHHRNGVLTDAAPSEISKKSDYADQSK
ncbi:replication initiation factor domain-containing protein [Enterococcus massiliensis]|nr:replication initiation factor domain-containing protein [Enterococcus massiliensis]